MPRIKTRALTKLQVKQVTEPGAYSDGNGLTLRVDAQGNKRWIQRLTIGGRQRNMGLGSWPAVSLNAAREEALANWRTAREGRDPIAERRKAKANARMPTFQEVAREVIDLRRQDWTSEKHAAQWESSLATYVYPFIGRVPVNAVTSGDVLALVRRIWSTKRETARRVRQRIEAVFDYAITEGRRMDNPAVSVIRALPGRGVMKRHHPAMAYGKLPEFLSALRESTADRSTKLALEYLILTVARSGEVRNMEWGEVDMETATWTVPAFRMKARREHRVPLSARALRVLEEAQILGTGDGLVFPSRKGRPLSNMAFNMLLRRLQARDAVPHGFRSSFKDWTMEAKEDFRWAVVEAALAHTVGSSTEAAYARTDMFDKRRELMEAWAEHCEQGGTVRFPVGVQSRQAASKTGVVPEKICVECQGPIPEERGSLDTCSLHCALAGPREALMRIQGEAERQRPPAREFRKLKLRHSLECQKQGASPNIMLFRPGPYFRCEECDCWCHTGALDIAANQAGRSILSRFLGS